MRPPESRTCQDLWPVRGCECFSWTLAPGPEGAWVDRCPFLGQEGCLGAWSSDAPWALSPSGKALGGGGGMCSYLVGWGLRHRVRGGTSGSEESRGVVGNTGGKEQKERGAKGSALASSLLQPHSGQETYLSGPRLLLRKRSEVRVTSSVRLQVAWSISL